MMLLVVDDDHPLRERVMRALRENGHDCEAADDGVAALRAATDRAFDVVILDRMMPGLDGLTVTRRLREAGVQTPILFLTNMSGLDDRVEGLGAGADDYLVKPFAFSELLARVTALARRPPITAPTQTVLSVSDLVMDLIRRTVHRAGRPIDLQPREFRLLEFLMRHEGQVVTRKMLLEHVWDFHFDPRTSIVETHVSRLRAKVDRGFGAELIKTVRGSGYTLRAASQDL